MSKSLVLLPLVLVFMIATGCTKQSDSAIEVTVVVSACVDQGTQCFFLPVPEAEIVLTAGSRQLATGTADAHGRATLRTDAVGQAELSAKSPLMKDGQAQATVVLNRGAGTSTTLAAPMSAAVKPGG